MRPYARIKVPITSGVPKFIPPGVRLTPYFPGTPQRILAGGVLIGISMNGYVLFNRDVIKMNWGAINYTPIVQAGLYVRGIARKSIKHRPFRTYRYWRPRQGPGPPRSRSSKRPFKLIYSVPDFTGTRVYVGMVGFGPKYFFGGQPVPGIHEHGAVIRVRRKDRAGVSRKVKYVYPKRAFMGPALDKAMRKIPWFWRNSMYRYKGRNKF